MTPPARVCVCVCVCACVCTNVKGHRLRRVRGNYEQTKAQTKRRGFAEVGVHNDLALLRRGVCLPYMCISKRTHSIVSKRTYSIVSKRTHSILSKRTHSIIREHIL